MFTLMGLLLLKIFEGIETQSTTRLALAQGGSWIMSYFTCLKEGKMIDVWCRRYVSAQGGGECWLVEFLLIVNWSSSLTYF